MSSIPPGGADRLLAAAVQVVRELGPARATTRAVTDAAGVGRGLLNHYFRWSALRAQAWSQLVGAASSAWLGGEGGPEPQLERFLAGAFAPEARPIWALWSEALDLARADPDMQAAVAEAQARHTRALTAVLADGAAAGAWTCPDPGASALRLLALHDGLILLILSGVTPLTAAEAEAHLRAAARLECPPAAPLDAGAPSGYPDQAKVSEHRGC